MRNDKAAAKNNKPVRRIVAPATLAPVSDEAIRMSVPAAVGRVVSILPTVTIRPRAMVSAAIGRA